jgi:hypothetical protein
MCGKPKVDTSYQDFARQQAEQARAAEDARQARVNEGLAKVRAVFEGGSIGGTAPAAVSVVNTPGAKKTRPGTEKDPMPQWVSKHVERYGVLPPNWKVDAGTTPGTTAYSVNGKTFATEAEARAAAGTATPGQTYGGIDPLLAAREEALRGFYLPQLDDKRAKATDELTFALSRAGLLNSSAAGEKQADLGDAYSLEKAGVLGDIASDISGTRTTLNQNRASIEAGLRASGDATAATNQALAAADTFRADSPKLSPLGDIFYGTAAGIGAARQGYDTGAVRRTMTPSPLRAGSGRNVRN